MNIMIQHGNCSELLESKTFSNTFGNKGVDLTFLDPPFNQDKEYEEWNDNLPEEEYWEWMKGICSKVFLLSSEGAAIYFMQQRKKHRTCFEVFTRIQLDFPKSYCLEEKNICGTRNNSLW